MSNDVFQALFFAECNFFHAFQRTAEEAGGVCGKFRVQIGEEETAFAAFSLHRGKIVPEQEVLHIICTCGGAVDDRNLSAEVGTDGGCSRAEAHQAD